MEAHLIGEMRQLVGPDGEALITAMIKLPKATGTSSSGIGASLTAAATLLLGASGVLVELRSALNTMWEIPPKGGNGMLNMVKDRLLSLGMVLAVGFLLLVSLMVSAILAALGKYLGTFLPFPAAGLEALNFFMSLGGTTILFALVFRYVPDAGLPWRSIWYGAVTTALLFTIGKSVIGIYLGRAGLGSPYGAAGSMVVLIVWIYYSAQIFLLGAEFTQQLATSEEKPHANA